MTQLSPSHLLQRSAFWSATLSALGLVACASPYPVYEPQPVAQAYPVVSDPPPSRDYRRRPNEVLYEAEVISVRAVMGPPEQRCWIEREAIAPQSQSPNLGGALVGAVIGGVIGHQIGGGSGRDLATAGGAVAGAVIGSNVGRDRYGNVVNTQNVQRCSSSVPSEPAYWDVIYRFRGVTHHAQMTSPPGRSMTVNRDGEPRE